MPAEIGPLAPERFGLPDRDVLEPARRASLLLVNGHITREVRAIRDIGATWRNGRRIDRTRAG